MDSALNNHLHSNTIGLMSDSCELHTEQEIRLAAPALSTPTGRHYPNLGLFFFFWIEAGRNVI